MILTFVGGLSCGEHIDTDEPGWWWGGELESIPPAPQVIEMHSHPANRTAYRLVKATPDECTYQIDPGLTAAFRHRPRRRC